jgi:hypothetical protein
MVIMKRTQRMLSLNRETVRILNDASLLRIRGAAGDTEIKESGEPIYFPETVTTSPSREICTIGCPEPSDPCNNTL